MVGHHGTYRHIQVYTNHITLLPVTVNNQIAVLQPALHSLSVYGNLVASQYVITKRVEIAWHHLILRPSWDTHHHVKGLGLVLQHLNGNITLPRILGALLKGNLLATHGNSSGIGSKQVYVQIVITNTIDIAWHRRDETTEVRRTAGTSEPRLARHGVIGIKTVMTVAAQGVGIEELTTIHTHTANHTIIQSALQTVDILGIAVQQEQALKQIYHRDGSTGLVVGRQVRQLIVGTKGLASVTGTYTTSKVVLARNNIIIDGIDGFNIVFIASKCSHIGHTGIHITSTHGMAPSLFLLYHRLIALRVKILTTSFATIIQQELSLVKIFLLASKHIQTGQRHLGNLVSRHHAGLTSLGTYLANHTIGITLGNVQELIRPCGLIVRTGSIYHMTEVIQLMTQNFLNLPTLLATPLVWVLGIDGAGRIKVAIGLLGSTYHIQNRVDISLQLSIGIGLQHIAGTLDGLIHIGIIEREAHKLRHIPLLGLQSGMAWVLQRVGSHLKILVTMLALTLRESQRDGYFASRLDTIAPEGVWSNFN